MLRTFYKLFTQSGSAQPLVGTSFTANTIPSGPAPIPGGGRPYVVIPVVTGDEALFIPGSDIVVLSPGTVREEDSVVYAIDTTAHTISCVCDKAHNSGDFIQLAIPFAAWYIQPKDGNAGVFYLGNSPNMSATAWLIQELINVGAGVQPTDSTGPNMFGANPGNSRELWTLGTGDDEYAVTFEQV